jgi:hypothetical protein
MSKKGSDLELPDFTPLISAMTKASDYSYKQAQDMFAWAKKTYEENKALGDEVVKFSLDRMRTTAEWADKDRKVYEQVYQPLQVQQAARAQDANDPRHAEYMAGLAEAAIADKFKAARDAAEERLAQFGVDPSQLRQGALDTGTRVAEASAMVAAGNNARLQDQAYADQLMAGAVQTGAAYPANIASSNAAAGQYGNQAVNIPLAITQSGKSTMGGPIDWQQLGNQSTAPAGQLLNASWNAQLQKNQADQEADSGIGTALGFGASLLTAPMTGGGSVFGSLFAEEGGKIPKRYAPGGAIPDDPSMMGGDPGTTVPAELSPSNGGIPDDVRAQVDDGSQINVNAGEFVIPKDVVSWLGEKGMQQFILKARKEMGDPNQAPAQPEVGPAPGQPPGQPPVPSRGVGAIPEMEGIA